MSLLQLVFSVAVFNAAVLKPFQHCHQNFQQQYFCHFIFLFKSPTLNCKDFFRSSYCINFHRLLQAWFVKASLPLANSHPLWIIPHFHSHCSPRYSVFAHFHTLAPRFSLSVLTLSAYSRLSSLSIYHTVTAYLKSNCTYTHYFSLFIVRIRMYLSLLAGSTSWGFLRSDQKNIIRSKIGSTLGKYKKKLGKICESKYSTKTCSLLPQDLLHTWNTTLMRLHPSARKLWGFCCEIKNWMHALRQACSSQYLSKLTKITTTTETAMLSTRAFLQTLKLDKNKVKVFTVISQSLLR